MGPRTLRQFRRIAVTVAAILMLLGPGAAAADDAWAALAMGGHVALIRHGNAPPGYGGDPPGFKIDDCKTQRNLDEQGREEARALGVVFVITVYAWTGSYPHPGAAARTPRV